MKAKLITLSVASSLVLFACGSNQEEVNLDKATHSSEDLLEYSDEEILMDEEIYQEEIVEGEDLPVEEDNQLSEDELIEEAPGN